MQLAPNRLAALRLAHDLTQAEVAQVVDRHPSRISYWERYSAGIPDDVKLRLADHFDVSVSYLMGWDR